MVRNEKETPEESRRRVTEEEARNNPSGQMNDAFQRANTGSLVNLVDGLSWKWTGILICLFLFRFIILSIIL